MPERTEHNEKIVDQHTQQAPAYARLTSSMAGRGPGRHELIGVRPDDELLDIACGPGSLTLELAPHIARATGLDITPAMLDQAREAQARSGVDNVAWVEGDGARIPFPDGAFSLVTCSAAFHHFEHPAAILAEMVRVCRRGGRVVVSDVTPDADKTGAYDRMERMRDPSHRHAHSLGELEELGAALGLASPVSRTSLAGPMPYEAVLATSFPEQHSREELLQLMREDGEAGANRMGFKAQLGDDGQVLVSYPVSMVIWTRR
jgi:ubiquinone/menaquinone biosynthesis C-methylase UbiE